MRVRELVAAALVAAVLLGVTLTTRAGIVYTPVPPPAAPPAAPTIPAWLNCTRPMFAESWPAWAARCDLQVQPMR